MSRRRTAFALVLLLAPVVAPAQQTLPEELVLSDQERQLLGEPQASGLAGQELAEAAHDLTARMRCPVCQGLSIADSTTPAARAIAARVEALLAAGYSEGQVLTYFEASYGEFIRLAPKPEGLNLVVWVLPVLVLLAAAAWLTLRARRAGGERTEEAREGLTEYLQQVREEVACGEVERREVER